RAASGCGSGSSGSSAARRGVGTPTASPAGRGAEPPGGSIDRRRRAGAICQCDRKGAKRQTRKDSRLATSPRPSCVSRFPTTSIDHGRRRTVMNDIIQLVIRGTLNTPVLDEVRKIHNETAGNPQGVAAARSLGDLSHNVFVPLADAATELLILDTWNNLDGLG